MDRFYVISNVNRDPGQKISQEIAEYLHAAGKVCGTCSLKRVSECDDEENSKLSAIPDDTECALVLGGDGTIIQVAGELAKRNIPIIGINLGRLGFLAEIDKDMIYPTLDKLINNECYFEDRMMLEGSSSIGGEEGKTSLALNDVVITRAGAMRVIDYDIYVNDKHLTTINGDGVVISTPTGSTGYSMSAGGPIVEPLSNIILVTPVSAHKLNSRPVVLAPSDVVTVKVASEKYGNEPMVQASFDGGITLDMDKDDFITVRKSDNVMRIIRISKESFLEVLSRKLSS